MNVDRCFYFGCWGNTAGHYMRGPAPPAEPVTRQVRDRFSYYGEGAAQHHLDGSLAPRRRHALVVWSGMGETREKTNRFHYDFEECEQGLFLLHHLDTGFTAVQWWDRTQGDTRPGCNSTVLLEGRHTAEEMLAALATYWPSVLANLTRANVQLTEVHP